MSSVTLPEKTLLAENAELRARLEEAEETVRAIRAGEVDALVVHSATGPQLFVLQSVDAESNRFRSDILGKVSDAVIAIDDDQRVIYLNAAAEQQYGATTSEALGRPLTELYENRWLRPEDEAHAATALRESGHWRGKNIHIKRGGEAIHVESSVSRLLAKDGNPSGLLSVIRDVSDQHVAEAMLRRNEALFFTIIDQAPGGVYVVDDQFRTMHVNSLARPVFAAAEPVIGRDFGEVMQILWGPELGPQLADIFRHTLATGERYVSPRFTNQRHDLGVEKSYDWEAQRLTLPNGEHGVVCYFSDVTEQCALEDMLVAQATKLARADRSKDEFLAMLAHELRNPLAPLRNVAALLEVGGGSPEERQQAQQILTRQIENMSRMIDDLLDVSRINEGKIALRRQPVALEAILTAAAGLARSSCAAHRQELTISLPAEPIYLYADATRLEQVFGNLLGNACKYSGDGSRIALTAERRAGVEPPEVVICVRDDGAGIEPELLPRIFDLFVQATRARDRAHGGLGIGLTLVQRIVQLHGGTIAARSEGPGHGAEFIIHLPILRDALPISAPSTPVVRDTPRRILIVDDNTDSARSLAVLQTRRGHEARTAFTGPDALAVATEFKPGVCLLDIGLPGMDGFEVARRLRAMPDRAGVILIAMTGYGGDEERAEARFAGFDKYMVKPVDLEELRDWLQSRA